MTQIPQTGQIQNPNLMNTSGIQSYNPAVTQQGGQTVTVSTPVSSIYQYPTTSLYDTNQKQGANGVNIYNYNPSGYGAPSTNTCYGPYNYTTAQQPVNAANSLSYEDVSNALRTNNTNGQAPASAPLSGDNQPLPAAPVTGTASNDNKADEKKQVTELSDDYIKMLESYLTNSNSEIRRQGIEDLIKRFEEDKSREKDPALTALLNIALQDPNASNRLLAMSPVASDVAAGDQNTIKLLENLTKSDKVYGQEAKTASNALLKATRKKG